MLYVSISKITLSNLPSATFTKRALSPSETSDLIAQARRDGSLMGVSSDDLAAPYQKRSLNLHVEVCEALQASGVGLTIKDFFNETFCSPLEFARVRGEHRLLVVEVGFAVNPPATQATAPPPPLESVEGRLDLRVSKLFSVSPEAFRFHLFEEITR